MIPVVVFILLILAITCTGVLLYKEDE